MIIPADIVDVAAEIYKPGIPGVVFFVFKNFIEFFSLDFFVPHVVMKDPDTGFALDGETEFLQGLLQFRRHHRIFRGELLPVL
jgi:hypothetical protein